MPLMIDMLLYSTKKSSVDLATIHANRKDKIATMFRDFDEYKFVRLAEVTLCHMVRRS